MLLYYAFAERDTISASKNTNLFCSVVYSEDKQQCDEVKNCKNILAQADVRPMVGNVVQSSEDVDKSGWVPAISQHKFIQ